MQPPKLSLSYSIWTKTYLCLGSIECIPRLQLLTSNLDHLTLRKIAKATAERGYTDPLAINEEKASQKIDALI